MQTGNLSTNPTSVPGRAVLAAVLAALSCFASAQTLPPEVQVGTRAITDFEFDWGRDGVYCPSCNGGAGNARMAYIDNNHDLWVGNVDVLSGDLVPNTGQGVLVDNNATTALEIGNGAEWMVSQRGSELVYTRWTDGQPRTPDYLNLGYARMNAGTWLSGPVDNSQLGVLPVGTLDPNDAVPEANFQAYTTSGAPQKLFWRVVSTGARNNPIPISSNDPGMTRRWVKGTWDIIVTAPAAPDGTGNVYRQVFLYHTTNNTLEQLTFDPVNKLWAFMWEAPEFGNQNVFFAMTGGTRLDIYRKLPSTQGGVRWKVVNSITMPPDAPYINSPEPFVFDGRSWIFFTLSADPNFHDFAPSLIAMTGIVPGTPSLQLLTSATQPRRARRDPEYFITANGPYIYYNRYLVSGGTKVSEGVFRVDTGLGLSSR